MTPDEYDNSTVEIEFKGIVQGYEIQPQEELFSIEVAGLDFGTQIINARISEAVTTPSGFESDEWTLNEGTIGQYAPVVIGDDRQVAGLLSNSAEELTEEADLSGETMENRELIMAEFVVGSKVDDLENKETSSTFFVTDNDDVYREARFGTDGDPSSAVLIQTGPDTWSYWGPTSQGIFWAFPLMPFSSTENYLVTHFMTAFKGSGAAGASGEIRIQFAEKVAGDSVFYLIPGASCTWEKSNYATEIDAADLFFPKFAVLEKATIFRPNVNYYLIFSETSSREGGEGEVQLSINGYESTSGSPTVTDSRPIYSAIVVDGVRSRWSPEGEEGVFDYCNGFARAYYIGLRGLGERNFESLSLAKYRSHAVGTVKTTDVLNRGIVFKTDGLADDASGTYTGTASALIENSFDVTKMLWAKSGRSLSDWDTTRFSGARDASRIVAGVAEQAITYRELAVEVLSNTASKLCLNRDGTVSYWPYGITGETVKATLTEDDCLIDRISFFGGERIVNSITVSYDKRLVAVGERDSKGAESWGGTISRGDLESQSIYGIKEAESSIISLNWLRRGADAEAFIQQYLMEYSKETIYISVRVPYWLKSFRALELWDIVILSHVDLPSIGGSASRQQAKPLDDFGAAAGADYFEGFGARDAKSIWCRVVERNPIYASAEGQAELILVLKKINNLDKML